MESFPFALYDAFTATPFGGSQAAVVTGASAIAPAQRHAIAREIGMPATAFVDDFGADWIAAQFVSAVMELPMCGHGTICLLTHLLESGSIDLADNREFELRLPAVTATVALDRRDDGRYRVMLDIAPPAFAPPPPHGELIGLLGEGEVHARLSALGPSDIYETRYPGVWLVTHYNDNEEIMSRFIEVIDMPSILKSQADDVRDGQERLAAQLG